jgi:hypothetical protein
VLLGHKTDIVSKSGKGEALKGKIEQFDREHAFVAFFESSAKDGTGVREAVNGLIEYILEHEILPEDRNDGAVDLMDGRANPRLVVVCVVEVGMAGLLGQDRNFYRVSFAMYSRR